MADVMNTGIYCIEHVASGKKYVGSAISFITRWANHRNQLRKGKHYAKHLQSAWNKYGEAAFEFKKLLVCSKENLLMYEQLCIDGYGVCSDKKGYNTAALAGSALGCKQSEETKAKKRRARLGSRRPEESREKSRISMLSRMRTTGYPAHKLNYAFAAEIRSKCADGEEQRDVAAQYGVAQSAISRIVNNKMWGAKE